MALEVVSTTNCSAAAEGGAGNLRSTAPAQRVTHARVSTKPYQKYMVSMCFYKRTCLNSRTRRKQGTAHPHPNRTKSR